MTDEPETGPTPSPPAPDGPTGPDPEFAAAPETDLTPSALQEESTLTPAPEHDDGTLVPDAIHDAPAYVPPALGMMAGAIVPPTDPTEHSSSAWITSAPVVTPRRGLGVGGVVGAIIGIVVVVAVVGYFLLQQFGVIGDKGKVLFGTAPGANLCTVGSRTTAVKSGDPVFFAAVLRSRLAGDQSFTFRITRDGQPFIQRDEEGDGQSFECYGTEELIGPLPAGKYVVELLHGTDVAAHGELTVTP